MLASSARVNHAAPFASQPNRTSNQAPVRDGDADVDELMTCWDFRVDYLNAMALPEPSLIWLQDFSMAAFTLAGMGT